MKLFFLFSDRLFLSSLILKADQLKIEEWGKLCSMTYLRQKSAAERTGVASGLATQKKAKSGAFKEFLEEYGRVWEDCMLVPETNNQSNLSRFFDKLFSMSTNNGFQFKGVILGLLYALQSKF